MALHGKYTDKWDQWSSGWHLPHFKPGSASQTLPLSFRIRIWLETGGKINIYICFGLQKKEEGKVFENIQWLNRPFTRFTPCSLASDVLRPIFRENSPTAPKAPPPPRVHSVLPASVIMTCTTHRCVRGVLPFVRSPLIYTEINNLQ